MHYCTTFAGPTLQVEPLNNWGINLILAYFFLKLIFRYLLEISQNVLNTVRESQYSTYTKKLKKKVKFKLVINAF